MFPLLKKAAIGIAIKKGIEAVSEMQQQRERTKRPLWRRAAPLALVVAGGALAAFLAGSGRARSPFSGSGTAGSGFSGSVGSESLTSKVSP